MAEMAAAELAAAVGEFEANGAVVVPGALTAVELERLRAAFAANRRRLPLNWTLRGEDRLAEDGPLAWRHHCH
jgi:hypothetical protein